MYTWICLCMLVSIYRWRTVLHSEREILHTWKNTHTCNFGMFSLWLCDQGAGDRTRTSKPVSYPEEEDFLGKALNFTPAWHKRVCTSCRILLKLISIQQSLPAEVCVTRPGHTSFTFIPAHSWPQICRLSPKRHRACGQASPAVGSCLELLLRSWSSARASQPH